MTSWSPMSSSASSPVSKGAASQQPLRMASGALSPPITSTAARTVPPRTGESVHVGRHLQRELRIDVSAVVACAVGELGVAALRAAHIVNRLERKVRTALSLAGFAVFLNPKHRRLLRAA